MSLYFLTPIWSFNMALCKIHMATTGLLPSLQNVNRRNTTNPGKEILQESAEKMIYAFISVLDILDVAKHGSCIILVNLVVFLCSITHPAMI